MKIFNKLKGDAGERKACEYLIKQNYKILITNHRNSGGEIDIIAKQGALTVFVEVKTRTDKTFGFAAEAVDFKKQQKIKTAATLYAQKYNIEQMRFDVVEVYIKSGEINHIVNAF